MKKLFLVIAAAVLLAPAALAQRTSSKTYFAGERITGVSATSSFDVVLVRSLETKAVVDINGELESHVRISRSADGVVSVGLHEVTSRLWRNFNRLPDREKTMRLTLYLPTLNTIRLSGASELNSSDSFPGENVDIQLSGASEVDGRLSITASRVKLQCSGASDASFNFPSTRDLVAVVSGASDVDITARGLTYSKIGVSGASELEIEGSGERGDWTASGASELSGEEFIAGELSVVASGASSVRVNVTGNLTAKTSGASSIRYAGRPANLNVLSNSVRPLRD